MVVHRESQSGPSPEENAEESKFLGDHGGPHEKRVGDQAGDRRLRMIHKPCHKLFHVRGKYMQHGWHKLLMVDRAVEHHGKAIGNGCVAYVKASSKDILVAAGRIW